jgi:glycosyltransferase involved in cell wall biosynthesis
MPTPILYVHHRAQISGAARSLADRIGRLDPLWEPWVLSPPGPVVQLFADAGARVTTGRVSLFQHTWDATYAGRKWLLLGREAVALPPHVHALDRLLRSQPFALVHLNDSPLLAAAAAARRHGVPVVWHLRSALSSRGAARPRAVREAVERTGAEAIAIDDDVARSFALRIPTTVVFNSVVVRTDAPPPDEARRRLGLSAGRTLIGFIGNLRRIKGWPQFVEAAALLRDEPADFVVVGGGVRPPEFFRSRYGRTVEALGRAADHESEMRDMVHARGLDDRFTFLPFTSRIDEVYPALDVVTFPNQGAGLGRPVLEAAAFGKPAVAAGSDTGAGILVPDRTGILLARGTPAELAGALRRLVRDEGLRRRLGDAARDHARARFDPEKNASAVGAVYHRVRGSER